MIFLNRLVMRNAPHLDKNRIAAATLALAVLVIIISLFVPKTTDTNSENTLIKKTTTDYPSRFEYQTSIFPIKNSGTISLMWDNRIFSITKDNSSLKQSAAVYPVTVKDKRVKYEISDTDIAEISSDGTIKAKRPGTVTVKATLLTNGYSRTSKLTIVRAVDSIFMPTTNVVMNRNDSYRQLTVDIFPENASDKNIKWTSKNPAVAIVDTNGTLKPIGKGMTEIIAETADKKHKAKCFVQVIDETIKPQNIEILNKESAYLDEGQSMTMIATVSPSNARDKSVSWTSSDSKVATVTQSGKIKAVSTGIVEISAKTVNGISDNVTLVVTKGKTDNPLVLYNKQTSANEIPRDVLGSSYINNTVTINSGTVTYVSYPTSLDDAIEAQTKLSTPRQLWHSVTNYSTATREQIAENAKPENYYLSSYKYQFLDLSRPNGLSAEELNIYLTDKGILKGQGQAFNDEANEYNISEIYLVVHACLETGNGTSTLARGVDVRGVTVYNMFGISAYDSGAVAGGSQKAYSEGWTTPEAAINGGAKWISKNYINNSYKQNTLYDMIWNPSSPGKHQYATDISWAIKQTLNIAKLLEKFPYVSLSYEIPVYEGETAIVLN